MQIEPASIVAIVTAAATAGAALYRLGSLEARVRELEGFRQRGGERIGKLEEVTRPLRRSLTAPAGQQVVAADAGGRVLAPVPGDESSS